MNKSDWLKALIFSYLSTEAVLNKKVIYEVFDYLKEKGIVTGGSDFSTDWLGQCESYYRGLRFKQTEPTLGVVAICASRLQQASEMIRTSPRHTRIADKFLELSQQCQQIVNEGAAELELV
jgi:hypothetical protein